MYNRYIRNDNGSYTRIPEEEPSHSGGASPPPEWDHGSGGAPPSGKPGQSMPPPQEHGAGGPPPPQGQGHGPPPQNHGPPSGGPGRPTDGLTGLLRHLLDQFHLENVDTGDLLLLALLFFLFREDADEELLVALGLLLIL